MGARYSGRVRHPTNKSALLKIFLFTAFVVAVIWLLVITVGDDLGTFLTGFFRDL